VPQAVTVSDKKKDTVVRSRDEHAKKMKQYADQRRRAWNTGDSSRRYSFALTKVFKICNKVWPQSLRCNRQERNDDHSSQKWKYITRNPSLFRKVNLRPFQWEEEDSDGDDDSADYNNDDREENHLQNNIGNKDSTRMYPVWNCKPVHRYIYES